MTTIEKALGVAALCLITATATQAQSDYPNQPIHLIVPFTPASTSDITARAIAQKIAGPLGQQVIVENRPGANGGLGTQVVAKSKPDGYTLVVGSVSSTVVPAVISKAPMFDLFKDLTPVAAFAYTPLVLTVARQSPYNSVAELVAAGKKAPGTMSYGNSAGLFQLAMEALNQQAGLDMVAIPYKGPADAANDLVGGRLTVNPDSLGAATRMIQAGLTKPLAVLSATRLQSLPAVPTMLELGYKDFAFDGWIGILAPAGTPEPIVQRLSQEIAKAVASEEIKQMFRGLLLEAASMSPKEYRDAMVRDTAKYERIARDANIVKQ
jgi:tripartite-type tricarboxylate transporter receptor subunit TctC